MFLKCGKHKVDVNMLEKGFPLPSVQLEMFADILWMLNNETHIKIHKTGICKAKCLQ